MPEWTFGRAPDCDVVIAADNISFRHCRLTRDGDEYLLEDLGSSNGTYVNGKPISAPTPVEPTDKILLAGSVKLEWPVDAIPETWAPERKEAAERPMTIQSFAPQTVKASAAGGTITIGRDPEGDVVITEPGVSWHHARLTVTADGKATLEDAGSSNGTFLNSKQNRIDRIDITSKDVVFLGSHRVPANDLFAAQSVPAALPEPERPITLTVDRPMMIGRDPECERVLDHPMVSWRHAKITRQADGFRVEDLGSTNGTFLNGKRITGVQRAKDGDIVEVASYSITLTAGGQVKAVDARGRYTVEARGISVDVPGKRLLENVSLTIHPGEFVGLMGPSGAGKSTLMNALNGYVAPSAGAVLISRRNLYQQYDLFRGQIGYVPQDDIMHGDLTVGEALYYTAKLRLPPDFSDAEIHERIDTVLDQLELKAQKDTIIGSPEKKGISGGQRKRVNLAMELLTDPSILFLDEPTSGLSSQDTLTVMKVLRGLADRGKTILLTIHQPSLEAYSLMDHLVLVAKDKGSEIPGCLAWFGPAFPDAVKFFKPKDAADESALSPETMFKALADERTSAPAWQRRFQKSDYYKKFVTGRVSGASIPPVPVKKTMSREFGIRQAWTLIRRGLKIRLRDRANSLLLLAQAPYIALLIILVFGSDARKTVDDDTWPTVANATAMTCFLLGLTGLWCGCSNAVREIVGEWAIYRRERMVNLKLPSYIASKFVVLMGLSAIQCFILLVMVYLANGLEGLFPGMFVILMLSSAVGIAIGLAVSALARTSEFAVTMLPVVILPMIMLGGALQPLDKMNGFVRFCSQTIPVRWTFESLLLMEAGDRDKWAPPAPPRTTSPRSNGRKESSRRSTRNSDRQDMAERFFPKDDHRTSAFAGVVVLFVMFSAILGLVGVVLRRRDIH